jgi:L-lactate dehydrogenase complex protein LldG
MNSRERIVARLLAARIKNDVLPMAVETAEEEDPVQKLTSVLQSIGGSVVCVESTTEIKDHLLAKFKPAGRWVSMVPGLGIQDNRIGNDPHTLENVQLSIIEGQFAVVENGAVWVTSDSMGDRALPFICEHIALVIRRSNIVSTMRQAYTRIDSSSYDFGTFIAGPSKTADIEQSLVLGAHGPKSLILFLTT